MITRITRDQSNTLVSEKDALICMRHLKQDITIAKLSYVEKKYVLKS